MDELEQDVIEMLLRGNDVVLATLRVQFDKAHCKRQMTGAGFFTNFNLPADVVRLAGSPTFTFGDVVAEITDLKFGAGFVMFVEDGALKMLEGYSYDEEWPPTIKEYKLAYASGGERDLRALQRSPSWPNA